MTYFCYSIFKKIKIFLIILLAVFFSKKISDEKFFSHLYGKMTKIIIYATGVSNTTFFLQVGSLHTRAESVKVLCLEFNLEIKYI
jgi:hypothetical protein